MPSLSDTPFAPHSVAVTPLYEGPVVRLTRETFPFAGARVVRDVVRHPGAVGVVALRHSDVGVEILLVRQYRHPVSAYMWEIPAGLRDIEGESGPECARRELREETGHEAGDLVPILSCVPSPGGCDEEIVIFMTWDPTELPTIERTDEPEEQDMTAHWWLLDEAVAAAAAGRIRNLAAVAAIFAVAMRVHAAVKNEPLQI